MDAISVINTVEESMHPSDWLTPLNLTEEREKFLSNPEGNPQLIYPGFEKNELKKSLDLLNRIDGNDNNQNLEGWILARRTEELKLKLKFFLHLNDIEFTDVTCQLYDCSFKNKFVEQAKKDAAIPLPFTTSEDKSPEQVVQGFRSYLAKYNINDWRVKLTDATDFYFRIRSKNKEVLVSRRFNWDFCDFDNTLAHEIDGHVLRAVNALKQENILLQNSLPFYIKTEEGLASFLGDYCSTTSEISRKHHALKYLAGDLARTNSFRDVFEFLVNNGFTPDLAFQRTFRLKRGLADTSKPGLFAKEAMYYEGMLEVKNYLDSGNSVEKLYSGKFGLEDLRFIDAPKDIIIPKRLKEYVSRSQKCEMA